MAATKKADPDRRKLAAWVARRLARLYPEARCTLDFADPLELYVATVLSAQCTDARVNQVTPGLFAKCRRPEDYLKLGVYRVILGTAALNKQEMLRRVCRRFPKQIAVGIDARDGQVAIGGWHEVTEVSAVDLARDLEDMQVSHIIYTDIARDGALSGPNLEATARLAESVNTPVVLSGGMHDHGDLDLVSRLEASGVRGVILGKSLYEGSIDLAKAITQVQREGDML